MPADRDHRLDFDAVAGLQLVPTGRQWPASQWREQLDKASGTDLDGLPNWWVSANRHDGLATGTAGRGFRSPSGGQSEVWGWCCWPTVLIRRTRRGLEQLSTPKR